MEDPDDVGSSELPGASGNLHVPDVMTAFVVQLDDSSAMAEVRAVIEELGGWSINSMSTTPCGGVIAADFCQVSDAALAAVRVARLVDALGGEINSDASPATCIAICTGEVDRRSASQDLTAHLRTHARELLDQADPYQILVNAAVAVLAGRALPACTVLIDGGPVRLGDTIQRIYELRIVGPESGTDDGDTGASNLDWARRAVGRSGQLTPATEQHLASLTQTWKATLEGHRRMVLLSGDDQTDLTAVVAELALRLHAEGALVLRGRWSQEDTDSYQAIREALGVYADRCSTDRLRTDLEGMGHTIGQLLPDVGARVSGFGQLQRHPLGDHRTLFEGIEAWLRSILARNETLLVLEDLHWAQSRSLLLLDYLWHTFGGRSLLIVVTAVDETGDGTPGRSHAADEAGAVLDRLERFDAHAEAREFERIDLRQ